MTEQRLTDADLERLAGLVEGMTEGPARVVPIYVDGDEVDRYIIRLGDYVTTITVWDRREDAEAVCALVNAAPALLAECRAGRRLLALATEFQIKRPNADGSETQYDIAREGGAWFVSRVRWVEKSDEIPTGATDFASLTPAGEWEFTCDPPGTPAYNRFAFGSVEEAYRVLIGVIGDLR